jgi:hypothetical protein
MLADLYGRSGTLFKSTNSSTKNGLVSLSPVELTVNAQFAKSCPIVPIPTTLSPITENFLQ